MLSETTAAPPQAVPLEEWTIHLIAPRDPLIARDGKPFNNDPGARASTLPFPFPSTTTGGVRTRAGSDGDGVFDRARTQAVKTIAVRGPLLVELVGAVSVANKAPANQASADAEEFDDASLTILPDDGDIAGHPGEWAFLAPAPRDCVFLESKSGKITKTEGGTIKQLVPALVPPDMLTTNAASTEAVTAFSQTENGETKALSGPLFWRWPVLAQWLRVANSELAENDVRWEQLGHDGPERDERTHVRLDDETLTHDVGGLFSTQGLVFARRSASDAAPVALALAVWSDATARGFTLREGAAHLGGERRLCTWKTSARALPQCDWSGAIAASKVCRVVLLTPAWFKEGWLPEFLLQARSGVSPRLMAACVGRPDVVSGWDFELGQAKPTRRLAPAGSTYFLRLRDATDPERDASEQAIEDWVKELWLAPISDDDATRRDGFGVIALGVADKEPREDLL